MIKADGFLDWTTRIDGIPDKIYSQRNSGALGLACHSIVGAESEFADGIPNRFLDTSTLPNGQYTKTAAASCMFVLRYSGELIQMNPIWASTWTSGGPEANTSCWAIEAEGGYASAPGGYDEPLRPAQVASMVRLAREWEAWSGRKIERRVTLWEHNELAAKFGYDGTACPSKRYLPFYAALDAAEEELEMTPDQEMMLNAVYQALCAGDKSVIDKWNGNGNSLILGYTGEQQRVGNIERVISDHLGSHPGITTVAGSVPPHRHEMQIAVSTTGAVLP